MFWWWMWRSDTMLLLKIATNLFTNTKSRWLLWWLLLSRSRRWYWWRVCITSKWKIRYTRWWLFGRWWLSSWIKLICFILVH
ncbi:unnamed protein product [Brugia timori]|uniref:Uncharacterized protein n=1 Tax=Brugia timori TaxID=42155 RepID=A0A3P7V0G0_9BILA|nr:unnamed protein product [Brugia timori]